MRTLGKITFVVLALIASLPFALSFGLRTYDSRTREELAELVADELSPGADRRQMIAFLRKHTEDYFSDDEKGYEYGGFRKKNWADEILYRKVYIELKVDKNTNLYKGSEVVIYYTWV